MIRRGHVLGFTGALVVFALGYRRGFNDGECAGYFRGSIAAGAQWARAVRTARGL